MREIAPHSSTAYHDLLTQKLKNHDATVDLFFMDISWVPEFASAGWALALDDLFAFVDRQPFLPATIRDRPVWRPHLRCAQPYRQRHAVLSRGIPGTVRISSAENLGRAHLPGDVIVEK